MVHWIVRHRVAFLVACVMLSRIAVSAGAATIFVATDGDNANTGSFDDPWRTLQFAVEQVAPGDAIVVRGGTYVGARIEASGVPGAPISLSAAAGEPVVLDTVSAKAFHGSVLEIENFGLTVTDWIIGGFDIQGGKRSAIDVRESARITVRGNRVHDNGLSGIFTAFVDDVLILDNESFDNGEHGIYVSNSGDRPRVIRNTAQGNFAAGIQINADASAGGDGVISNARLLGNVIFANGTGGGSGINLDGVDGVVIANNLIFAEHASGISLFQIDGAICTSNARIVNNTVVVAQDGRWALNIPDPGCTGNWAANNILWTDHPFRGSIAIAEPAPQGFRSEHNVVMDRFSVDGGDTVIDLDDWIALGYGDESQIAEPIDLFVNVGANDYHLKSGSPAIDAGRAIAPLQIDLEGNPRSGFYDIGAYEAQE